MQPDMTLLMTITAWYHHPTRLAYNRCWTCGKRRFFAEWFESYQTDGVVPPATRPSWGWLCAPCIIIVGSKTIYALHDRLAENAALSKTEAKDAAI